MWKLSVARKSAEFFGATTTNYHPPIFNVISCSMAFSKKEKWYIFSLICCFGMQKIRFFVNSKANYLVLGWLITKKWWIRHGRDWKSEHIFHQKYFPHTYIYEKSNILIYYIKNLWQQSEFKINLGFLTTTKVVEMTNQPSIWDKIGSKNSNIHTYWVLLSRMIVYNVDILIIRIAIRWVR